MTSDQQQIYDDPKAMPWELRAMIDGLVKERDAMTRKVSEMTMCEKALSARNIELAAAQARIELLEHDAKSGDYETLYAQAVMELQEARAQIVSGFYEERVPAFQQGAPTHELQDVVTAAEVTGYVARIEQLRGELSHIREYWNGFRNDRSMYDALTHIEEVVDAALAPEPPCP